MTKIFTVQKKADIEIIEVNTGEVQYPIYIGSGSLNDIGADASHHMAHIQNVVLISDTNIENHGYVQTVKDSFERKSVAVNEFIIPPGEQEKSFERFEKLMEGILELKPDRNWVIIALGGGVVGDLAGFIASSLLRGVSFIQIPTTLLSLVDSSVGGKTAINSKYGKNLIGSFYQPTFVLADIDVLKTLPKREYFSGYAEVFKYACIENIGTKEQHEFFDYLEKHKESIKNRSDEEVIKHIISRCCEIKANIVSQDEKEKGMRALLNFGHTLAHSLEKVAGYSNVLKHGEAVSIGMVFATKLSCKMPRSIDGKEVKCCPEVLEKITNHLQYMGLPVKISDVDGLKDKVSDVGKDMIMENMYSDKKVIDGVLNFILLQGMGNPVTYSCPVHGVEVVREVLNEFLQE